MFCYWDVKTQSCRKVDKEEESFTERLRRADEEFKGALEKRDAATRIASQPGLDQSDEALRRRIAQNDASVFRS